MAGSKRGWRAWLAAGLLPCAVAGMLVLAGCGDGPAAGAAAGVELRLAPTRGGAEATYVGATVWLPVPEGFVVKSHEATAQYSKLMLSYVDKKGQPAALVLIGVAYGEPDQTLDEKYKALIDEVKVEIQNVASYQAVGEPAAFQTVDGMSGQQRLYKFQDPNGQMQLHAFGLLDLRKRDAVYVRAQLLTPEGNGKMLQPKFQTILTGMKHSAP